MEEMKVKVMINDNVTEALAEIQDEEMFQITMDSLDELNEFIFSHEDDDASTTVNLLRGIYNTRKLLSQLNGKASRN